MGTVLKQTGQYINVTVQNKDLYCVGKKRFFYLHVSNDILSAIQRERERQPNMSDNASYTIVKTDRHTALHWLRPNPGLRSHQAIFSNENWLTLTLSQYNLNLALCTRTLDSVKGIWTIIDQRKERKIIHIFWVNSWVSPYQGHFHSVFCPRVQARRESLLILSSRLDKQRAPG